MNSNTRRYASDLTDEEWAILEPLIPAAKPGGRPRRINMREVVNGIFYLLKTGCQWRMLPKDFPKWKTVHDYFAKWRKDGTWQRLNDALRERVRVRVRVRTAGAGGRGRDKTPSAGSIDSQSVKTTEKGVSEAGVSEAGMGANTSRDANGTLLWTHLGWC